MAGRRSVGLIAGVCRFAYFERRVAPLRLWRDYGGALYTALKHRTHSFAQELAQQCDQRRVYGGMSVVCTSANVMFILS